MNFKNIIKHYKTELILVVISFLFSYLLMFSTFSYGNGNIEIASKAWSDFASHIPLIRSFSFGNNFPPQYPLFSGPPIKYHFLFYSTIGLLEKFGVRLDLALNSLSAFGFMFLMIMIYCFAKNLFKSKAVGILSVIFLIFNGSLNFIKYFANNPISINTFSKIITNNIFVSFGPYDGSMISAFWNLNIYTNQRHLALSYALSLLIIYLFINFNNKNTLNIKRSILLGFVLGLSFLLNMAVFLMTVVVLVILMFLLNKNKLYIFISLLVSSLLFLPSYLFMQSSSSTFKTAVHFGYLINNLNLSSFLYYWFENLGLNMIFIPIAFLISNKLQRRILFSFLALFLIGNIFQFSPEIAANHKFFNYFLIVGSMFTAYFLVLLWKKTIYVRPLVLVILFFLIISGILDFFPIFNDRKIILADYPNNKNIAWIIKNTKPNSTFLNTQYLYDDASMAGRKIFLGWPYFAWSQGYDTLSRDNLRKQLLVGNDLNYFCKMTKLNNINYAELNSTQDFKPNFLFFEKNFNLVYKNNDVFIYKLNTSCKI